MTIGVTDPDAISVVAENPDLLMVPLGSAGGEDREVLRRMLSSESLVYALSKGDMIGTLAKMDDADKSILMDMLSSKNLVHNMNRTNLVGLLAKFEPSILHSLSEVMDWDLKLLRRLSSDQNHLRILHRMWDLTGDRYEFADTYFKMLRQPEASEVNVQDAFSSGQISSKSWLCDVVADLGMDLGLTWILCGWVGTLGYLLINHGGIGYGKIRSFDIDANCGPLADVLNKRYLQDDWKFKSVTMDVNLLGYDGFHYGIPNSRGDIVQLVETPDTVINTSCDHMTSNAWWESIPAGKTVILQNNNWEENDQHHDTVADLEQFKQRYPMEHYMFEGELDCKIYRRFMLIGRK